mgnify:CR=1 FL=1
MGKQREDDVRNVREISVDPQPSGLSAVYLVETRSDEEAAEVRKLFRELESQVQVRILSRGKLMSYVVQADESDTALLDEIESVLKANYGFVVAQDCYDETIYRIIRELCQDTGSTVMGMSRCNICGKAVPFPTTVVSLSDEVGSVLLSRSYCASCTAGASAPSNKEFVRSLLSADRRDFGGLERVELVRRRSRKQNLRFKIKTDELAQAS